MQSIDHQTYEGFFKGLRSGIAAFGSTTSSLLTICDKLKAEMFYELCMRECISFNEFLSVLSYPTDSSLLYLLTEMETDGLIQKEYLDTSDTSYSLTKKGRETMQAFYAMTMYIGLNIQSTSDRSSKKKKPNTERLSSFGFTSDGNSLRYSAKMSDDRYMISVILNNDMSTRISLIDRSMDNEAVIHSSSKASISFENDIRTKYDAILINIAENCSESDVFKTEYARSIIQYIRKTYNSELEFLWPKFSENAIFRRHDTDKWYGAILTLNRKKLGFDIEETIEILDLRMRTDEIDSILDGKLYFPGYHMNKKHWITICLDGSVPIEEIFKRIDESYALAFK